MLIMVALERGSTFCFGSDLLLWLRFCEGFTSLLHWPPEGAMCLPHWRQRKHTRRYYGHSRRQLCWSLRLRLRSQRLGLRRLAPYPTMLAAPNLLPGRPGVQPVIPSGVALQLWAAKAEVGTAELPHFKGPMLLGLHVASGLHILESVGSVMRRRHPATAQLAVVPACVLSLALSGRMHLWPKDERHNQRHGAGNQQAAKDAHIQLPLPANLDRGPSLHRLELFLVVVPPTLPHIDKRLHDLVAATSMAHLLPRVCLGTTTERFVAAVDASHARVG
mmetsp:Transcript_50797/g.121423  ORF Transcript_50797/g.121423 Transcript_50797/m.121423 type:complete len:276 (-) Transcript_50797:193-1020(-)